MTQTNLDVIQLCKLRSEVNHSCRGCELQDTTKCKNVIKVLRGKLPLEYDDTTIK